VFNGVSWGAFASLAAKATSAPSCTGDSIGGAICMVLEAMGKQYNTVVTRFNGSSWSTFLMLHGIGTPEPNCTDDESHGEVSCFVRGQGGFVYGTTFDAGAWSMASWTPWATLPSVGEEVISQPSCVPVSSFNLACAVIGVDSALWVDHYNGTSWSGWSRLGNTGIGTPSCATLGTGKVLCSFVGVNNEALSVTGP
jgi:hypothetical protein